MAKDKDYKALIHTPRWQKLRHAKLSVDPWCQSCMVKKRRTAATEVHHITPVETAHTMEEKVRLMFMYSNLESVCHTCHANIHLSLKSKSRKEQRKRQDELAKDFCDRYMTEGGG